MFQIGDRVWIDGTIPGRITGLLGKCDPTLSRCVIVTLDHKYGAQGTFGKTQKPTFISSMVVHTENLHPKHDPTADVYA